MILSDLFRTLRGKRNPTTKENIFKYVKLISCPRVTFQSGLVKILAELKKYSAKRTRRKEAPQRLEK